uniref:Uncharacterized protein n=1 Tax=Anguilla anguilla TaxID=7936 RepID=A0A0E9UR70_ANGAN
MLPKYNLLGARQRHGKRNHPSR